MRILIYVPIITFDSCVGNSVHVRELAQNLLELGNEVVVIANLSNSAYDGTLPLYLSDHPDWCSFYPSGKVTGRIDVTVNSLARFLKDKRRADIIRIDVEGYEYEVGNGMLESNVPLRLFIESHPDIMGKQRAEEFLSILKHHQFQLRKVIPEPNIYPLYSRLGWQFVDFLDKKQLKMKFGRWEMTLDELLANEPIMSGKAGAPALFLKRDASGSE